MNRRHCLIAALGLTVAICSPLCRGQTPAPPMGELKPLGEDRFQIGRIVVDKRAGTFTVPGRVQVLGKPLEYLATSPGGRKGYESLLELDATGSELNLACILVGLERPPNLAPFARYSRAPLPGQRVAIYIAWSEGTTPRKLSAADALLKPLTGVKTESIDWVYLGSPASKAGGPFAADVTGTLIGFVHDPTSVLESVGGVGIGAYGAVQGNSALPPAGSAIELIVEVPTAQK
jgi:hypothetical protein